MRTPITPDDVADLKTTLVPDAVLEVFNAAIAEAWDGSVAVVQQDRVATDIAAMLDISRGAVFDLKYLNVEPIYRNAGLHVVYDKPGYNETYAATFKFTKAKEQSE